MTEFMKVKVITPDRVFYTGDCKMVELRTTEGDIGVYPDHVPLTAIVAPGTLILTEANGEKKKAALHAGFIEILAESITILAEVAEWPDEIDKNRAMEAKIRAERRLSGNDGSIDVARAELALKRALVRINMTN